MTLADPPFDGSALTAEATRPASTEDILGALSSAQLSRPARPAARRGRPPGSKNLTPEQRLAKTTTTYIPPDGETPEQAAARKLAKVKADAAEISKQIGEEVNDYVMSAFIALGLSPDMLYKPGQVPVTQAAYTRYTDLGNKLAIPPGLAKSAGRLAAELKNTDTGKKLSGEATGSKAGVVVAGIMTIFGTIQYARSVSQVLDAVKMMEDAKRRAEAQANEPVRNQEVVV